MSIVQSGLAGLQRAEAAAQRSAQRVAGLPLSDGGPAGDVVDISAEAVALMAARNAFAANLRVVETGNEMQKSTLDMFA